MPGNKAAVGGEFGTKRDRARLAKNIRGHRLMRGWNKEQLSEMAGLGINGAGCAEDPEGYWPSLITVTRIAQALGAKVSDLIGH